MSGRFIAVFLALTLASLLLIPFLGRDFFPEIRSGEIDLHMRAQIGTRIEEAGKLAVQVSQEIRKALPAGQVTGIVNNCGLPVSGIAEVYSASGTIGPQDCDMTISLARDDSPVQDYRQTLHQVVLPSMFPGTSFTFLPGDITAKILNFGLPAPIDIQVVGRDQDANFEYAKKVLARVSKIPGIADPNIYQAPDAPTLRIAASRSFASGIGLTEADVANDTLATLSGSGQVAPSYWLDAKNGVSYLINVQTPQSQLDSMNGLETLPIDAGNGDPSGQGVQLLGGLSHITQTGMPQVVSHYSITPTIDIYASVQGRDLGAVNGQRPAAGRVASGAAEGARPALGHRRRRPGRGGRGRGVGDLGAAKHGRRPREDGGRRIGPESRPGVPAAWPGQPQPDDAGADAGLVPGADLCPGHGLRHEVGQGLRRRREEGRRAGDHRDAGPRPEAAAGAPNWMSRNPRPRSRA